MKNYYLFLIALCLLLSSCSQPIIYTGEKYPKTASADVYYSAREIKKPYKIVGHMVGHKYSPDIVKFDFVRYAKRIGADAVIISGVDTSVTGKPNRVAADAVKYDK